MCIHTMTWHVRTKSAQCFVHTCFVYTCTRELNFWEVQPMQVEHVKKEMKIQQEEKYDEPKIQHNKLILPLKKTKKKKA